MLDGWLRIVTSHADVGYPRRCTNEKGSHCCEPLFCGLDGTVSEGIFYLFSENYIWGSRVEVAVDE